MAYILLYVIGMTLLTLERALRKGKTPDDLKAKAIGQGVQKTAYLVHTDTRDYVIKKNTGMFRDSSKRYPPNLQKYGVQRVIQRQVNGTPNGDWLIQEATTLLHKIPETGHKDSACWNVYRKVRDGESFRGDYHAGNFGVNAEGRLVCFDW